MTQAVVTRRDGDVFQARMFWLKAANLLDADGSILRVGFESGLRGFDDDFSLRLYSGGDGWFGRGLGAGDLDFRHRSSGWRFGRHLHRFGQQVVDDILADSFKLRFRH